MQQAKQIAYYYHLTVLPLIASCDNANHELEFSALYSDLVGAEDFDLLVKIAVEGDTIADVAAELGITVEACKKRVQRAKARLKKALEKITDQQSP